MNTNKSESINTQSCQTAVIARCNNSFIDRELKYVSQITRGITRFKVKEMFVNTYIVGKKNSIYAEVFFISENGNKYKVDEISEVRL